MILRFNLLCSSALPQGVYCAIRLNIKLPDSRTDEEKALLEKAWQKAGAVEVGDSEVGAYELCEQDYPRELEKYGFRDVTVSLFMVVDYCPDSADVDHDTAIRQINCRRQTDLAPIMKMLNRAPDALTPDELERLCSLINSRYDERIRKYERHERVWDFSTSTILAVSAVK